MKLRHITKAKNSKLSTSLRRKTQNFLDPPDDKPNYPNFCRKIREYSHSMPFYAQNRRKIPELIPRITFLKSVVKFFF